MSDACYLAIDVHYQEDAAFVAGLTFSDPSQTEPDQTYYSELKVPGEYQSGEFYKRELPCILKLIEEHSLNPSVIIIDGYTYLDEAQTPGLGAHLVSYFCEQGLKISVIGVAKNPRRDTPKDWEVYRGTSSKPLYVKAIGLDDDFARHLISGMAGDHRQPTLLKLVDRLCRDKGSLV